MTTATATHRPQAVWIGRYLASSYVFVLLWALGIGVAVYIILANAPIVFDFVVGDKDITPDGRWFYGPPTAAVTITAFVVAIVNSGYSRVLIGQGATRRSIAAGNLLAAMAGLVFIIVVRLAESLLEALVPSYATVETHLGITMGVVEYIYGAGIVTLILVFGSLIAATFQRWHWLVGVVGLVLAVIVLPATLAPIEVASQIALWPGTPWILAVLTAGLFAWVLRGVEVN